MDRRDLQDYCSILKKKKAKNNYLSLKFIHMLTLFSQILRYTSYTLP